MARIKLYMLLGFYLKNIFIIFRVDLILILIFSLDGNFFANLLIFVSLHHSCYDI